MTRSDERDLHGDRSPVLDDDALEDVGHVLAAVGGLFEQVEDLLPLDEC